MRNPSPTAGFSLLDLMTALLLMGVMGAIALPAGRSTIRRYQLNSAAKALHTEISRTRLKALESNSVSVLRLDSEASYEAAGKRRQLPANVHFSDASADSIVFDRLGFVGDGQECRLVLVGSDGAERELRVRPSGTVEERKL